MKNVTLIAVLEDPTLERYNVDLVVEVRGRIYRQVASHGDSVEEALAEAFEKMAPILRLWKDIGA